RPAVDAEPVLHRALVEDEGRDPIDRLDAGGPRLLEEQGHLAEDVPGAHQSEGLLLSAAGGPGHRTERATASADDHEGRVADVPLLDDQRARFEDLARQVQATEIGR